MPMHTTGDSQMLSPVQLLKKKRMAPCNAHGLARALRHARGSVWSAKPDMDS
jgi:hypothetical protein